MPSKSTPAAIGTDQPWGSGAAPVDGSAAGRLITSDIPGVGGRIKARAEDFVVEEIPLYEPVGSGEHLYLMIEKTDLTTSQAVGILAHRFNVRRSAVGYAGLKDKRAVTRQLMSVHLPGQSKSAPMSIEDERLRSLWSDWHANKLRVGHLSGNRFTIRIREVDPSAAPMALRTLRTLERTGVANRAGEQRFGRRGNNHRLGRFELLGDAGALLDELLGPTGRDDRSDEQARQRYAAGDHAGAFSLFPRTARTERQALRALTGGADADRAVRSIDATQRRFWVSAFQSAVFNAVLDRRIEAGALDELRVGDLAFKHNNGAVFLVDDDTLLDPETQRRLGSLEISPTGPIWGSKMTRAGEAIDTVEIEALRVSGVTFEDLIAFAARSHQSITGARRPLRAPMRDPSVEAGADEHGPYIQCRFELPKGAFATEVMREIMMINDQPAASAP